MIATFTHLGKLGRMGNTMFQIAATIGYAKRHGFEFAFPKWSYQQYFKNPLPELYPHVNRFIPYQEKSFNYYEIPAYKQGIDLYGYFQSEKHFAHCKDEIKHYFCPEKEYEKSNFTSIHIRRTDYLELSHYHNVLPLSYYHNAISHFDNTMFMVFSDDISWCMENFKGDNFVFIKTENDIEDFFLMSGCKNNIIANSSYSWWAAWLNDNPDKKVIAPKDWFGVKANKNPKDLYCEGWLVL